MAIAWLDLLPHPFKFQTLAPLRDRDLLLIPPDPQWVDELLATCAHPLTQREGGDDAQLTRGQILQFLRAAPNGHEPADPTRGRVPTYHFWMLWLDKDPADPFEAPPAVRIAGGITLRAGLTPAIEQYYGHIGYHVYPPARGHHFAERSARLLLPLARHHKIDPLWITCNPDNFPSRTTCQRLGAQLINTVNVPATDPLYERGDHQKCRYRLETGQKKG